MYNLFKGLAVSREEAIRNDERAQIFTDHIDTIWCSGDRAASEYMHNWIAHLIQKPWIKMSVVPALKGGQGVGKGIAIGKIGAILGDLHFLQVLATEMLTGQFQQDKLKTNLLTFLDECTYAGDKKTASRLKGLFSEDTRLINTKYVNAYQVKNTSNHIIAGNFDSLVLVESDDRRFFCLNTDNKFAGVQTEESARYFNLLGSVDIKHIAYYYYNRDISKFNYRQRPSTEYLRVQKKENLSHEIAWLEECLQTGRLCDFDLCDFDRDNCEHGIGLFGSDISEKTVYISYQRFAQQPSRRFQGTPVSKAALRRTLANVLNGEFRTRYAGARGQQVHMYMFGEWEICRNRFCAYVKESDWHWETENMEN